MRGNSKKGGLKGKRFGRNIARFVREMVKAASLMVKRSKGKRYPIKEGGFEPG